MSNEFYTPSNAPSTGAALSSATMRAEFQAISTGLDKLPTMTGNGNRVVVVNSGGTALQAVTSVNNLVAADLSTTGNTTLGDASTDTVTVNGYMGVGGVGDSTVAVRAINSGVSTGFRSAVTSPTSGSGNFIGYTAAMAVPVGTYTATTLRAYNVNDSTVGAGSTISAQYGLYINDLTTGTQNYGVLSAVSSGTNKWNIFASGTAANYFAGNVAIGTTAANTPLMVYGTTAQTQYANVNTGTGASDGLKVGLGGASSTEGFIIQEENANLTVINRGSTAALILGTNNTERLRIDSSGYVGVGTGSAGTGGYQFAVGDATVKVGMTNNGGTAANVGAISNHPLLLVTNNTERMRIDSTGTLVLAATNSNGIQFPATQVSNANANTLDDYEEGLFTPTIEGTSTAGTGTYSVQVGRYTKIGNRVNFSVTITWSAHTGTGNMVVGALPFTSANVANNAPAVAVTASNLTYSGQLSANVSNNSVQVSLATFSTGGALTALPIDTAATIYVAGHYEV